MFNFQFEQSTSSNPTALDLEIHSLNQPDIIEKQVVKNEDDSLLNIQTLDVKNAFPLISISSGYCLQQEPTEPTEPTEPIYSKHNIIKSILVFIGSFFVTEAQDIIALLLEKYNYLSGGMVEDIIGNVIGNLIASIIITGTYILYKNKKDKFDKHILTTNNQLHQEQLKNERLLKNQLREKILFIHQKTEIYSHVSHEIRNPLQGLLFELDTLKSANLTPEQKEALNTVTICSKQIENVVNDILRLHKLETTEDINLLTQIFNLTELVNAVFSPIKARAKNKQLKLICKANLDFNSAFSGDFKMLTEVLTNFLTNAVKFTQTGFIKLLIRKEQEISPDIMQLHFTVQDSGMGMSSEQLNRIFKPYCQAETTIEENFGGTGLGLSIVHILIKKLNKYNDIKNSIGVLSSLEQGSIFWFRVRLKKTAENLGYHQVENLTHLDCQTSFLNCFSGQDLSILVVEDGNINQKIMNKTLTSFGCKVTIANNGLDAIDIIKATIVPYDLIFMDIEMPIMNGIDATIELKTKLKVKTPIVACTGNGLQENINKFLSIGMDDVIVKPITPQCLFIVLNKIFSSRKCFRESSQQASSSSTFNPRTELPGKIRKSSLFFHKLSFSGIPNSSSSNETLLHNEEHTQTPSSESPKLSSSCTKLDVLT